MKVVVELSKEEMESYKNLLRLGFGNTTMRKVINGTPLPEGVEILTKEAYDLCLRASRERKTGKWVRQTDDYHDYYECENCGIAVGLDDVKNYCPNCGLKMALDENDEKHKVCEERKQNCYECPFEDDCVEYRW